MAFSSSPALLYAVVLSPAVFFCPESEEESGTIFGSYYALPESLFLFEEAAGYCAFVKNFFSKNKSSFFS